MGILYLKKERLMKFEEESDPIKDLGIGLEKPIKEHLKQYEVHVNVDIKGEKIILTGNFNLANKGLNNKSLAEVFKKHGELKYKVKGNFYIDGNNLTSLVGCPTEVHGSFSCTGNPLESLDGLPKVIKGNVWIV